MAAGDFGDNFSVYVIIADDLEDVLEILELSIQLCKSCSKSVLPMLTCLSRLDPH